MIVICVEQSDKKNKSNSDVCPTILTDKNEIVVIIFLEKSLNNDDKNNNECLMH